MDLGSPLPASKQLVITLIAACLVGFTGTLYYLHIQSVNNRLISQYNGNVYSAIEAGDLKAVKLILEMEGNQPGLGFDLNRALSLSIDHTHLELVRLFLGMGADVSFQYIGGISTPGTDREISASFEQEKSVTEVGQPTPVG